MFPKGVTPTFILSLPFGWDLTLASKIVASFRCDGVQYDISDMEIVDANTVAIWLTQEQTMAWPSYSTLKIQLNWVYPNGVRASSNVWTGKVSEQLLPEVI